MNYVDDVVGAIVTATESVRRAAGVGAALEAALRVEAGTYRNQWETRAAIAEDIEAKTCDVSATLAGVAVDLELIEGRAGAIRHY